MTGMSKEIQQWLKLREWILHPHQVKLFETRNRTSQLLIAPTDRKSVV